MTKFGMSLKDELIVTISKERFEDFISPFLADLYQMMKEKLRQDQVKEI